MSRPSSLAVFGLGYVGTVTAACFARIGHRVVGVDVKATKVDAINAGRTPVSEPGLAELIRSVTEAGQLTATTDARAAVQASDVSLVCVGTPSDPNGGLDTTALLAVCTDIGGAIRTLDRKHLVVIRSTMLPGTAANQVIPRLEEASGMRAGADFGVCVNPEFLREGTSLEDFDSPPFTLIGELDSASGDTAEQLYGDINADLVRVDLGTAEMVKYTCNAWHAVKVAFGNEVGVFCKEVGVDSHRVMDVFFKDCRLNLSAAYLKPGFSFGGSCLPKDVRALLHRARLAHLQLPVLTGVIESNALHTRRALDLVMATECRRVGILGLSFKENTDDLRESPIVALVKGLLGEGRDVRIYDPDVDIEGVQGVNLQYITEELPHIASLLVSELEAVLDHAEVVVIGKAMKASRELLEGVEFDGRVIDLARPVRDPALTASYEGIAW